MGTCFFARLAVPSSDNLSWLPRLTGVGNEAMVNTDIVILAAGKGTRMRSSLPKVLHAVAGKPLLEHVLTAARTVPNARQIVVVGHGAERIEQAFCADDCLFVQQAEQLGTAHAVQMALTHVRDNARVLVLYADVPLINPQTIAKLLDAVSHGQMSLLTIEREDPSGYGRIVRSQSGEIDAIVEHKDARPDQLDITEVNTGVLAITAAHLKAWLPLINNQNSQKEYYLTDLIAIARAHGHTVKSVQPLSQIETEGINDRLQLSQVERAYQLQLAHSLLNAGTSLADPARFDVRGTLSAGTDNFIDVNCVFEGDVVLGSDVIIGPNCSISGSVIGDGVEIKANSVIESSIIGDQASVGPFARLRAGTQLGKGSKIGNFVETKKAQLGKGSKVSHLSYVGDAKLGDHVNIGAGTITCNYDGVNKHQTTIGHHVFVGSNSTLVSPLTLADGSFVAAGSTLTRSVDERELGVGRAKQRNISGWTPPREKHKRD